MINNASLVFVFATRMEADPFVTMVNAGKVQTEPWPIYQAEIANQQAMIIVTGMGMTSAKTAIEFMLENYVINTIYNCGEAIRFSSNVLLYNIGVKNNIFFNERRKRLQK